MATIDPKIYIAHSRLLAFPDAPGTDAETPEFEELHTSLEREATEATAILVLGGYFNPDYVLKLCTQVPKRPARLRRDCRVRIVIGLERVPSSVQEWERLRQLRTDLEDAGFGNVRVKAIVDRVHFHTKLFGFRRDGEQTSWYVGSANPTPFRHEMMVKVSGGRHASLALYAKAAIRRGSDVRESPPDSSSATTLREFFLSGSLAYKSVRQSLYTFDPFRFKPDERAKLDAGSGARMGLRYASPQTEGYGFKLTKAFDASEVEAIDEGGATELGRVHHRPSSVETAFGFWVPQPYSGEIRARFEQEAQRREEHLERFATLLTERGAAAKARAAFKGYLDSMVDLARGKGIRERPREQCLKGFSNFLESRIRILSSEANRRRQARTLVITPMPDIWQDERSSEAFEDSFFAEVAYRTARSLKKGRAIRSIENALARFDRKADLTVADEVRDALTRRLMRRPWTAADWEGLKETESDAAG